MSGAPTHPSTTTGDAAGPTPGHLLDRLRQEEPLVQCLTNAVVTNFTANVLLAIGAAPAMADIPTEAREFAGIASGVLVNLGTPHADQRTAMVEAATAAREAGTPWVLDPVAVGALSVRTALAAELLDLGPTVVRGNPSEVLAVAGTGAGGRGVDSTASSEEAADAAADLAGRLGCVVAVSGEVDVVTDGRRTFRLANGHPLLTRVTGGGCALGAVVAAYVGLGGDPLDATVEAVTAYTVAAELAAAEARGPGSFAVGLLDRLAGLDADTLARHAVRR